MACSFNNLGFGTIDPGPQNAQRWWVTHGRPGDCGAQFIMAHPLNPGGSLNVSDENMTENNDGSFTYWVTITNVGGLRTNFSLSGGGLS